MVGAGPAIERRSVMRHKQASRMMSLSFKLRFPEHEIAKWARLYDHPGEAEFIAGPVAAARQRGYLDMDTFMQIGDWKSPRPRRWRAANAPAFVERVTRLALSPATPPRQAIEALIQLSGVNWPTASVILHLCHTDPYPILDFRALWSLSTDVPNYNYAFWEAYTAFTRSMATRVSMDMRTLDRGLWKYSELHQGAA
jgi:hypothetical protein